MGLRLVFATLAKSEEEWYTLKEMLPLLRTLKPHKRMNFLVVTAVRPLSSNRSHGDVAAQMDAGDTPDKCQISCTLKELTIVAARPATDNFPRRKMVSVLSCCFNPAKSPERTQKPDS